MSSRPQANESHPVTAVRRLRLQERSSVRKRSVITSPSTSRSLPAVVSLFCGAGGLDLGFRQAGFNIAFAVDSSEAAIRTHRRNFPETHSVVADLKELTVDDLAKQLKKIIQPKSQIGLIGGPPCQGFSRANTHSRADDPRNSLPFVYLEIVDRLRRLYQVEFVIFENVLGIRDKKHAATYSSILGGLGAMGFHVSDRELCSLDFGIPQRRKRVVISATRFAESFYAKPVRSARSQTVRQAIGNLAAPVFFDRTLDRDQIPVHPNHWTMRPKSPRFSTELAHSTSARSFKKLRWDEPSPTIAFGHREIYVHPDGTRRLSILEAMRLQGFPDSFVLEGNLSEQVEQVSNAVPPPLGRSIARAIRRLLQRGKNPAEHLPVRRVVASA